MAYLVTIRYGKRMFGQRTFERMAEARQVAAMTFTGRITQWEKQRKRGGRRPQAPTVEVWALLEAHADRRKGPRLKVTGAAVGS